MASDRQISANQKNAKQSTGPATAEGRAVSSKNATRHGLFARAVLLSGEDPVELELLSRNLRADLMPVGALEELLVEQLIACVWRLGRLTRIEAGLFALESATGRPDHDAKKIEGIFDSLTQKSDEELRNISASRRADNAQPTDAVRPAVAFYAAARRGDVFSTFCRYETAQERAFSRKLHELQRLQATRRGQSVSPPAVLDVTVEGASGLNLGESA